MHFAENLGLQQLRRTTATEYYWEQQKDEYSANARTHAPNQPNKPQSSSALSMMARVIHWYRCWTVIYLSLL